MPIPRTRPELIELVRSKFEGLAAELMSIDERTADRVCTEEGWTVREILCVRVRWTEMVLQWIRAGRAGVTPDTPAAGYSWRETPQLNRDIVAASVEKTFDELLRALHQGVEQVLVCIDELSDRELLDAGVFEWAGKWPISRWISVNTATQYASARTLIRKAV